jgi:heparosan-N-sulfate-glucuronate 5-epimerase
MVYSHRFRFNCVSRLQYYRRIFQAYLGHGQSHLTFWHDAPEINSNATFDDLGEYYMPFSRKADYAGYCDPAGIPMLDYRGRIGLQYNPIAVAQWGLGNYNLFARGRGQGARNKFLAASDWLCSHLEQNGSGLRVWNHHFDWEYRTTLKSPWHSALAQGQGISLLVRAYRETGSSKYRDSAAQAFEAFLTPVAEGGVAFTDAEGHLWFEEYLVTPATHILNGFIWATWGVFDYFLASREDRAHRLFVAACETLQANLQHYDLGFWSLYEQSGTPLPMVASPFYHRLHIVQLRTMHRMTGIETFARFADKWEAYASSRSKRTRALCYKSVFKLCYY